MRLRQHSPHAISATTATVEAEIATTPAAITNTTSIATSPDIDAEKAIVFISFANTSIDSGSIDIYSDLSPEPVVTDLIFGEATELVPFPSGTVTFTARVAGSGKNGEILAADQKDFGANGSWIVTMAGLQSKVSLIVEPMSIVRNNYNGQGRVRVVNFIQDSRIDLVDDGNSLRALVKYLDNVSDDAIAELNIPTGIPLVYQFDDSLKPIQHYYLGNGTDLS